MPIKRIKYGDRHPHVVVLENDKEFISVGLTTKNPRDDLKSVKYSNEKTGYIKRNATREYRNLYSDKNEKYNLDLKSENVAYRISMNKLLKDIGKDKKKKHFKSVS